MEKTLKKLAFIVLCMMLGLVWTACRRESSTSAAEKQVAPLEEQARGMAQAPEKPAEPSPAAVLNQEPKPAEVLNLDPNNVYAKRPHKEIPYPLNQGTALPWNSEHPEKEAPVVAYQYSDPSFLPQYQKELKDAGFKEVNHNLFIKRSTDNSIMVVWMEEGEGEAWVRMATTLDPEGQYKNIPHESIPYPLDNGGLAAEYIEYEAPNEASNETVYTYIHSSANFESDYEARLKEAGFHNIRLPESPLYVLKLQDNIELSVAIDNLEENVVRIRMMASVLDTP